jgi:serine/threonine protein kinase
MLVRTLGEGSQGETYEAIDVGDPPTAGAAPDPTKKKLLVDEWDRYVRAAKSSSTPPRIGDGIVAIKCFRLGRAKAWKDVELAEREATTLRSLNHPRLPKYIEHFEEDGALYLVMEKIEGESLAELRKRKRTWTADEVTRMLEDVADALRYLGAQSPGIVHRDIKPGNVIRRRDGSYAIVDFGSVRDRLRPAGGSTVVGTFGYMAPEQFQGRASPKSDVYGAAATALTMLTGEEPEDLPHQGLGIDVARAVPKNTPPWLVRALASMLEPDPDRRASSVDEALAGARRARSAPPTRGAHGMSMPPMAPMPPMSKREARKEKHRRKRHERRERRRARGGAPFLPRLVARLALLVAAIAVTATVGFVVPLVLNVLSLVFGASLRRAAAACFRAAHETRQAFLRASSWLDVPSEDPRVRVGTQAAEPHARVADAPQEERDGADEGNAPEGPEAEERKRRARA